ncbi:Methyltransferase [Pleurostoma richardsiae]|uniref:Methyltransferase n=1 Tax=Pleurostoma richardsiae TaxID=41990 RepID=A0AA38VFK3_9PEZI|nr:Methyltransferase [Pleurostoma richardsiae]
MTEPDFHDEDDLVLEPDNLGFEADSDSVFSDPDSALGDEMSLVSSTASLRSSVMRAREENGRKYHGYKDGKYVLPIDDEELARQEYQYHLCLMTFDQRLSFTPLTKLDRVLDIGCGTGFWAMDFVAAEAHPEAEVIGVDLSPIQPAYVPPNVQFEIDDLEEPWNFSFQFDYIHSLMMTGAFRDWPYFYRQAFENLKPGGWLEIQDMEFPLRCDDGSMTDTCVLKRWSDLMVEAGERSGFSLTTCGKAAETMQATGFVDIVRIPFKWPINRWPKEQKWKHVGQWTEDNFRAGVETMMLALFTRFMGWTKEQVVEFSAQVRHEFQDVRQHAYFNLFVTYGRKP